MRYFATIALALMVLGSGLMLSASSTFAITGSWSTLAVKARMDATMAYDNLADRFVFFGGTDGYQKFNEVWEMWPGYFYDAWQKMPFSQNAELPSPRDGHTIIYDPVAHRLILFGGKDAGNNSLNDVWSLALATWDGQQWQPMYAGIWQQLTTTGVVPPLSQHTAVLDSQRRRMLVYGGEKSDGTLSDQLYSLDLATLAWSTVAIFPGNGPHGRQEHVAIYDAADDAMFVYGGEEYYNGNYSWASTALWRLRLNVQSPQWDLFLSQIALSASVNGAAVYDASRNEMVLYGGNIPGEAGGSGVFRVPLAYPTGFQDVQLTMSIRRESVAYAYDALRSQMKIFGGSEGTFSLVSGKAMARNDTWNLALGTSPAWSTPYQRPYAGTWFSNASMVFDDQHGRTFLFGGYTGFNGAVNGVFALGLSGYVDQWAAPNITGTPPSPRYNHSAIYDRAGDRMVVFGGWGGTGDLWALNRTGGLDLSSNDYQWVQLPNAGGPGPLAEHTAVYADISPTNRKMIVFGGKDPSTGTLKSDTWSYDLINQTWTHLNTTGQVPAARAGHGAVYDYPNRKMYIFGGIKSTGYTNDVYYLDLNTNIWNKAQFTGPKPAARAYMNVVLSPYADASMIVFGGDSDSGLLSDAWAVRVWNIPYGTSWSQITPTGVFPGERTASMAVYQRGGQVLVAGGNWYSPNTILDEHYNDTWTLQYDTGYYASLKVKPGGKVLPETATSRERMSVQVLSSSRSEATMQLKAAGDPGPFDLAVYDVAGRLLRHIEVSPLLTESTVTWDFRDNQGSRVPSGIYFIKLKGKNASASKRIVALH